MVEGRVVASFEMASMVRGFHVYEATWTPSSTDRLLCARDVSNTYDPFAVSVVKGTEVVGHVPKIISAACFLFLRRGGSIQCEVTGDRRYSTDLPQGGMELPCILRFQGPKEDVAKVKKLLDRSETPAESPVPPASKRARIEDSTIIKGSMPASDSKWLKIGRAWLEIEDKTILLQGNYLNDRHINYAQALLKEQFPKLKGLHSTLQIVALPDNNDAIQIIHCKERHHWMVASTILSKEKVYIYDSFFTSLDESSEKAVKSYFGQDISLEIAEDCPKQHNAVDCGVFSILFATALAHGLSPCSGDFSFNTAAFRTHITKCFTMKQLYPVLLNCN